MYNVGFEVITRPQGDFSFIKPTEWIRFMQSVLLVDRNAIMRLQLELEMPVQKSARGCCFRAMKLMRFEVGNSLTSVWFVEDQQLRFDHLESLNSGRRLQVTVTDFNTQDGSRC